MLLPLNTGRMKWKKDGRVSRAIWRSAKPFIENNRAVLIHRPREIFTISPCWGKDRYVAVHCFCGAGFTGGDASGSGRFTFLDEPHKDAIVCQRCEDAAVSAGLPSSSEIVGRHVHLGGVKTFKNCCGGLDADD